ncbi:hypothetical protein KUTeg_008853 [Tegillarca granosa]|uniref:Uncharacterized protein n=1 Tax=Tegillarca granosa TaxID=220873 RepID=A0ABQ9FEL7_TEGGR|nr:hypothetical protein KUTeg_008853 [Tegillarca granosa]
MLVNFTLQKDITSSLAALVVTPLKKIKDGQATILITSSENFREEYRKVGVLQSILDCPVLSLTATATKEIKDDIASALGLTDFKVISTLPNRQVRY